jgi:hypothetical protein
MVHTLPTEVMSDCSNGFMYCFSSWASDVTNGLFWFGALFAFCIILFLASLRFGTPRAFGFSSFVGMIGGIWLSIMKLTAWWVGSTFIIIGFIGLAVLLINEKN